MRPTIISTLTLSLLIALVTIHLDAQTVVSRFDGSVEKGIYEADFDAFMYATGAEPSHRWSEWKGRS